MPSYKQVCISLLVRIPVLVQGSIVAEQHVEGASSSNESPFEALRKGDWCPSSRSDTPVDAHVQAQMTSAVGSAPGLGLGYSIATVARGHGAWAGQDQPQGKDKPVERSVIPEIKREMSLKGDPSRSDAMQYMRGALKGTVNLLTESRLSAEELAQLSGTNSAATAAKIVLDRANLFLQAVCWPVKFKCQDQGKAKETSKSRNPNFPNFLGLVLGCTEAKF